MSRRTRTPRSFPRRPSRASAPCPRPATSRCLSRRRPSLFPAPRNSRRLLSWMLCKIQGRRASLRTRLFTQCYLMVCPSSNPLLLRCVSLPMTIHHPLSPPLLSLPQSLSPTFLQSIPFPKASVRTTRICTSLSLRWSACCSARPFRLRRSRTLSLRARGHSASTSQAQHAQKGTTRSRIPRSPPMSLNTLCVG